MDAHESIRQRAEEIGAGPEAAGPLENWLRAEREHEVAHFYDTLDRDLERLGMTICRLPSEAGVVWRLTLPRGERVEAWEPGTAGLRPPHEVMALVGTVLDGKPLVPEPAVLREGGGARLREKVDAALRTLLVHDPGVRLGADPENLRRHHVAARQLRAYLRTARRQLDPEWARAVAEPLRALGEATGPLRDLDVLIDRLDHESFDRADADAAERLILAVRGARAEAQTRVVAALESSAYRLVLARLRFPPRFREGVETVPLEELARTEFRRLARVVTRLGSAPPGDPIHGLRDVLQRVEYAAELAPPDGFARTRFHEAARALQDLLGEHRDALVAESLLRETTVRDDATAAAFAAGRVAERQVARRARAAERLPGAWRRLRKRGAKLA